MLPILAHQEEILTHLAAGNRLVLTAPTGSGKTTQIPQILHRARQARIAVPAQAPGHPPGSPTRRR